MPALLGQLNMEMAEVVKKVRRSLVQVHNGSRGVGSGAIWHPDGLIVTNAHVVSGHGQRGGMTRELKVTLPDGNTLPARLLAQDTNNDIAALMVERDGLTPIELGASRGLQPGQWTLALGFPWGVAGAVTGGAIIGSGSDLPETPSPAREWIEVGLSLRPGHSGGPLVDAQGRLVGINTMMAGPEVGMAVPVHLIKQFLRRELGSAGPVSKV